MNTAQLILAMRTRACMTQAELAKAIGVNPSTVCTLESPTRRRENSMCKTIMRIANACGVSVAYTIATDTDHGSWGILPSDFKLPF